jgi:hypothetical protein
MHKSATKCNETLGKWCKNKHGASKIIDTLETYHSLMPSGLFPGGEVVGGCSWRSRRISGDRGPDRVFRECFQGPPCLFLGPACNFQFLLGP